jgi:hypothetical protein
MSDKAPVKSPIQLAVERKLKAWLNADAKQQPSRLEVAVLDRALKYLSIQAKLDETDFGGDLDDLNEGNGKAGTYNESDDN